MTEPKVIGKGEGSQFAAAIQKYLAQSGDISGMVTERMVSPQAGEVSASYAGEFMRSVALAIHHEVSKAEEADREPNVGRALKAAGCSEEMYLQMSDHPDYLEVCKRINRSFIVMPRWPMICRAMTKAAQHGDVAAARWVANQMSEGEVDAEEALRQIQQQGPEGLKRMASELQLELHDLLGKAGEAAAPDELIRSARAEIQVQRGDTDRDMRASARALYGIADDEIEDAEEEL